MRKEHRNTVAMGLVLAGLLAGSAGAFAFGLSDEDYDYLQAQHIDRNKPPMLDLSPKERTRIHDLITDSQTAHDPAARDKNVKDAPTLCLSYQLWEKAHPGKMWNEPGTAFPN